jgi:hypothetical protein
MLFQDVDPIWLLDPIADWPDGDPRCTCSRCNRVAGLSPAARRWRSDAVVIHHSWTLDAAEEPAECERFGPA